VRGENSDQPGTAYTGIDRSVVWGDYFLHAIEQYR